MINYFTWASASNNPMKIDFGLSSIGKIKSCNGITMTAFNVPAIFFHKIFVGIIKIHSFARSMERFHISMVSHHRGNFKKG